MLRLLALALMIQPAFAARLEIPLRVPLDTVREALAASVSRELYREGRCRYLNMEQPKLEIQYWHALFAAAATPKAALEKLNATLAAVLDDPALVKSWTATGVLPYAKEQRSLPAAQALFKSEIVRWGEVVRENKIQAPE